MNGALRGSHEFSDGNTWWDDNTVRIIPHSEIAGNELGQQCNWTVNFPKTDNGPPHRTRYGRHDFACIRVASGRTAAKRPAAEV
jgi:hypothetical protein